MLAIYIFYFINSAAHCMQDFYVMTFSHLISTTVSITEIPASCGEYIGHQVILVMKFSGRLERNTVPVLRIDNSLFGNNPFISRDIENSRFRDL